jgi:hypothetical protein
MVRETLHVTEVKARNTSFTRARCSRPITPVVKVGGVGCPTLEGAPSPIPKQQALRPLDPRTKFQLRRPRGTNEDSRV